MIYGTSEPLPLLKEIVIQIRETISRIIAETRIIKYVFAAATFKSVNISRFPRPINWVNNAPKPKATPKVISSPSPIYRKTFATNDFDEVILLLSKIT